MRPADGPSGLPPPTDCHPKRPEELSHLRVHPAAAELPPTRPHLSDVTATTLAPAPTACRRPRTAMRRGWRRSSPALQAHPPDRVAHHLSYSSAPWLHGSPPAEMPAIVCAARQPAQHPLDKNRLSLPTMCPPAAPHPSPTAMLVGPPCLPIGGESPSVRCLGCLRYTRPPKGIQCHSQLLVATGLEVDEALGDADELDVSRGASGGM